MTGPITPMGRKRRTNFTTKVWAFASEIDKRIGVEFVRIAVTPEQIDEFNLPTRPTKKSDTRAKDWIGGSVEVDAIPATQLRALVEAWIESHVDQHELEVLHVAEDEERDLLQRLARREVA